jgi:hypothetical protein
MNNRNFPSPSQQFQRPRPDMSAYAPPRILMGLIGQSEKRYMSQQEALMKLDAGLGDLDIAFEGEQLPSAMSEHLRILFAKGSTKKQKLEELMKDELDWQDELKRFLMGRGPRAPMRRPPQLVQGGSPGYPQYLPQQQGYPQQYPQQYVQPQQAQLQQPQPQQPQQILPETVPQGPIDYRDPKQAAAALLRAQPMPLGPLSNQPNQSMQQPFQGGAYVPPYMPGVPPAQAAYGVPPGAYVSPPSQVPVVAGGAETATQVMQQSQPQQPVVNVPTLQPNGVSKNATS